MSKQLYKAIDNIKVDHYYTGSWIIDNDFSANAEQGLKKTEMITVVFILVVLIIVFRSIVSAFIPLVTVGLSYISIQSIIVFLVDQLNFPLSTFSQMFLV